MYNMITIYVIKHDNNTLKMYNNVIIRPTFIFFSFSNIITCIFSFSPQIKGFINHTLHIDLFIKIVILYMYLLLKKRLIKVLVLFFINSIVGVILNTHLISLIYWYVTTS